MGLYSKAVEDESVYGKISIDSVRSSQQSWLYQIPINTQLAVAGTAEDLWAVNRDPATRNIITNPSMETADPPTGYTAVGSTISRSAAQFRTTANSLQCILDNAAAGEGFYWQLATNPPPSRHRDDQYTFSVYLRGNAGGETVRLRYWNATDLFLVSSNILTLDLTWQRLYVTASPTLSDVATRLYVVSDVQQAGTFFADDAQFEVRPDASAYCDGTLGRMYAWEGAAHASTSVRRMPVVEIKGYSLKTDLDVYIDFDRTATSTSELVEAGTTWWNDHPVAINAQISILNANVGERPRIRGHLWGVVRSGSE